MSGLIELLPRASPLLAAFQPKFSSFLGSVDGTLLGRKAEP
jgi:hypothetical protein